MAAFVNLGWAVPVAPYQSPRTVCEGLEWQAAHPNITCIGWGIVWTIVLVILFWHERPDSGGQFFKIRHTSMARQCGEALIGCQYRAGMGGGRGRDQASLRNGRCGGRAKDIRGPKRLWQVKLTHYRNGVRLGQNDLDQRFRSSDSNDSRFIRSLNQPGRVLSEPNAAYIMPM
jgi:hypothetical protein